MGLFKKKEEYELSDVAVRHSIKVSKPYGYYPESVDKILLQYETKVNELTRQNAVLENEIKKAKQDKQLADAELANMKLQVSMMEIPETSEVQDIAMMQQFENISRGKAKVDDSIVPKVAKVEPKVEVVEKGERVSAVEDGVLKVLKI